jgi:hypothetical protein
MDNQHKQIKGYRDLSQEEIDLMNKIKALAEEVGVLVDTLQQVNDVEYFSDDEELSDAACEANRWICSAKKDLQLGFMQLTRAVAKPTTF